MDERELREVFEAADVGWVFADDPTVRAQRFLHEMYDVDQFFYATFRRPLDPPVADAILADLVRFKPLVQTFASPMTTPMRTMVYCVLDSAQVTAITFEYKFKARAHLEVDVMYDSGEHATFWDVEALRHFGLMKMGEAPVIDGYYAFRKDGREEHPLLAEVRRIAKANPSNQCEVRIFGEANARVGEVAPAGRDYLRLTAIPTNRNKPLILALAAIMSLQEVKF